MRYWPVSQRPRSTSAQRRQQNGRVAAADGLPQTGHFPKTGSFDERLVNERLLSCMCMLDDPFRRVQCGIGAQDQGTPGPSRKVWQCLRIGL
jgi:hypothetical protein